MAAKCGRFHVASALLACFVLGGLASCAGSGTQEEPEAAASERVQDVVVESEAGLSRVILVGLEEPVFTAFQQADPDRLIVDLAGVDWQASTDAVEVNDGTILELTVAPFATGSEEAMTRVELSLVSAADYDVRPGPRGLVIEVSPLAEMGSLDEPSGDAMASDVDPWASPVQDAEGGDTLARDAGEELADAGADSETDAAPMSRPASVLERVDARAAGEGVVIHLVADGSVDNAASFTLADPPRLVIDLEGMKSTAKQKQVEVGGSRVQRVRVGAHADKVRVVVDGAPAGDPFEGRQVMPIATGLLIALGEGAEVEAAVAEASGMLPEGGAEQVALRDAEADAADAPDASAEAGRMPADGIASIQGVSFDSQPERDRVVIQGEQTVDYLVYEPDPETVVLSITRARLAPEAAVRIAPEAAGPVSLVTAFDQPDVKSPEVRVVMKRASNLKPAVTREGTALVVAFPRDGEAAKPPVLAMGSEPMAEGGMPGDAGVAPATTLQGAVATLAESGSAPLATAATPPASLGPMGHSGPASMDSPASIDLLNEGGLMDGKEYVGRRISLDFKEVEIADVLRLVAEVSDLNVIAGDEVKGKVTIRLVDVPWDQALDVILLTKGLGFARIGNVLRIAANDVLAQEEELRLQERRAKEKLEDLVVKLQPVNYASVDEVAGMVTKLLTERGSVNKDKRTNTLIIKDIASVIDEATALVKAVDTMTPQVMIESKIVEANLDFSRELGAVWSFGTNPLTQSTLGGRDYVFTSGPDDEIAEGYGNQLVLGNPITANPTGLLSLAASVIDEKFDYELQIQAAEVNGDGKVISSPRVVTLDNSTAQIEQGVSIPFQTFENGDAQLEFVDAVLKLKVTPHITSDQSIIMEIEVSRNAPDDSVFTLTGSPAIAKNQVKTETLVKDGQTLVLGGIYVVDKSERQSRLPYLHRVPFLGNLFKSNEFSDSRKELLIFVTPRVVQTPTVAS
jgi:type IV pilus assembly protein PilQ